MDISTVYVKNISSKPISLTFTTNDSYLVNPQEKVEIPFVEPTSIYYLIHYVKTNKDLEFYDKDDTLLTQEIAEQIEKDFDMNNGVPPYRDLVAKGELKTYVDNVLENSSDIESGLHDVTIKFMSGDVEIQEPVVEKHKVGSVILGTELKSSYSIIGDYNLDNSSANDFVVKEDESQDVINLIYVKGTGNATIKCIDVADSSEIKQSSIKTGELGTKEVLKPETIEGYENPTPGQRTITYSRQAQEVIFSYTKKAKA